MLSPFKYIVFIAVLAFGFFRFCGSVHAEEYLWHTVGSDHFAGYSTNNPAMTIASDGTIYVAFPDVGNGDAANVMTYDGSDWSLVGPANFSAGGAGHPSLALDATDTPYVAYADAANGGRVTVMRYDGSTWATVGSGNVSAPSIEQLVIAIDPDGIPYVTYVDVGNGNAPTTVKLNGSTWQAVGTPYAAEAGAPTMAFSTSGTPYVAFSNIATGEPTVISFDGSDWNLVGDPLSVNLYANAPLAMNASGTLYIATSDLNVDGYPVRVFSFDGSTSTWSQVGNDFAVTSTGNLGLAINQNGIPYISLADLDSGEGTVIAYTDSSWTTVGNPSFTSSTNGDIIPLAINPTNGGPYVAYSDSGLSDFRHTVMAYLPTAPGQVRNLTASGGSPPSISLSWDALTDTGGSPVTGYRIERASAGGDFSTIAANIGISTRAYTDSNLHAETSYTYRVSGINDFGTGKGAITSATTGFSVGGGGGVSPVQPTAMRSSGSGLTFTINGGAQTAASTAATLGFNADPQTVRGYAASLDPTFTNAGIYPLERTAFLLSVIPGPQTVYLKYYSITGDPSPVLSQTIFYQPVAPTDAPILPPTFSPSIFTRQLKRGSKGPDVKALQQFLNAHGFTVSEIGAGSPGHETDYFGSLTAAGVTRFQEANASTVLSPNGLSKGTGIFGPATRSLVILMMAGH